MIGLTMRAPLFQIDAFTAELFGGNPAAVVLLEAALLLLGDAAEELLLEALARHGEVDDDALGLVLGREVRVRQPRDQIQGKRLLELAELVHEVDVLGLALYVDLLTPSMSGQRERCTSQTNALLEWLCVQPWTTLATKLQLLELMELLEMLLQTRKKEKLPLTPLEDS